MEIRELPFDQYQRYRVIKEIISVIKEATGTKLFRVLDIGGYCIHLGKEILPITEFLPEETTYAVDIQKARLSHYIQGTGLALPIKDKAFDIVVTSDTFEHIPREKRQEFLKELLRVSSKYIIISGPFNNEKTLLAEKIFQAFHLKKLGTLHPFLEEHFKCSLPELEKVETFLNRHHLKYITFPSGYLYTWLIMMLIKHYILSLPNSLELHTLIDKFYNMSVFEADQRAPSYRQVIVISKEGKEFVLKKIKERYTRFAQKASRVPGYDLELFQLLLGLFELEERVKEYQEETERYKKRLREYQQEINSLKEQQREMLTSILKELSNE
jgi:hypothetical protein